MTSQKEITRVLLHLPVPSSALRRITAVLHDMDASADDVADVIKMDPTLSGKVLRLANSASVGIPRSVSSLQQAVVLLGVKRLHSLVVTTELLSSFKNSASFPLPIDRFRRHSVTVAFIAEAIGRHLRRYRPVDESELFSAALLHDIGKLLAGATDPEGVAEIHERCNAVAIPYYRAENDILSHAVLGKHVAESWGFPVVLTDCIRGHHCVACFPDNYRIVSIVHIADVMAHLIGYSVFTDEVTPAVDDAALLEIGLPTERLRVIADEIISQELQIDSLLEVLQ